MMKFKSALEIFALIAAPFSVAIAAESGSAVAQSPADAEPSRSGYEIPPYIDGELAYHHHPLLRFVFYDPKSSAGNVPNITRMVTPPKEVGIEWVEGNRKFREIHTHEPYSGRLHTESTDPAKKYQLGDFIELWAREWGELKALVERAENEGTIYLFDYDAYRGEYRSTRLKDASALLTLTLDDGRHIVVYLPEKKETSQ